METTVSELRYGGYFRGMPVSGDAPVGLANDKLSFGRYVDPLIAVLTSESQETPFTIGIFGPWGSGKSSLLRMLGDKLVNEHADAIIRVDFNAWVHRHDSNILVPLLHTIRDTLRVDTKQRFVESAKKIAEVLVNLGADLFLKAVTASSVSLETLEKLEQQYLARRLTVESEMRNLRETLRLEIERIHASGVRLVILVDDLDRCEPDQIVSLLDSVKLFLDIPHVFVVLAVDREVIRRGIQVRYREFEFAKERADVIGHEYLEKMVQLPFELFPLDASQIAELVKSMIPYPDHDDIRELVNAVAPPNARKIKRLVNIFAVVRVFLSADEKLKALDRGNVLRLVALQVLFPDLYWALVALPAALEALERKYSGELKSIADYGVYEKASQSVRELCEKHYQPDGALAKIFAGSRFGDLRAELDRYFSMVGGSRA